MESVALLKQLFVSKIRNFQSTFSATWNKLPVENASTSMMTGKIEFYNATQLIYKSKLADFSESSVLLSRDSDEAIPLIARKNSSVRTFTLSGRRPNERSTHELCWSKWTVNSWYKTPNTRSEMFSHHVWNFHANIYTMRHKLHMSEKTRSKYNYISEWNSSVEALRRKFSTARIPFPCDENSVLQKLLMAKNPYGKNPTARIPTATIPATVLKTVQTLGMYKLLICFYLYELHKNTKLCCFSQLW